MSDSSAPTPTNRPLIIGGGVSGLMAAIHLADLGLKPLLLEADPTWIGGRLKDQPSIDLHHQNRIWRFPAEHGVHGIWSPYRNFQAALARYDIRPVLTPAREETWILGRGKKVRRAAIGSAIRYSVFPAPFHYLFLFLRPRFLNILTLRDLASLFRVFGGLIAAMSIDPLAEQRSLTGLSLADFTAGWSPSLQNLFAGLARNALAAHPTEAPASGFIAFLRFYTLLRRDAWMFDYLPGTGGRCVSQPLADVARALGATITLGARATCLQRCGPPETPTWQVTVERAGQKEILTARHVILAVDAPAAQKLLTASPDTAALADNLFFPQGVPTAIVRLWFEKKPNRGAEAGICSGDFVMDNFFWLDRLQPAYMAWSKETGGSAIEMHVYGPPELLALPDAMLLARVIVDLNRAFPELRGYLLHKHLQRNEATHTLFGVGQAGAHLAVETPWAGLFACGDWVYHPAPALYLERATITGIAAANALLTRLGLTPWPILPSPQPEWLAGKMANGLYRLRQQLIAHRSSSR